MNVLGLDIGGANLKAATADGDSCSVPFEMWRRKGELGDALRTLRLTENCRTPDIVAVVMTAELADCFSSKAEGVEFVIRTVQQVFPQSVVRIWLTSGEFADPDDAAELPQLAAAANWHALATWAGRAVPCGPSLLIDIGSTTTDIIPLLDGIPVPEGFTDLQRLVSGELVYTGIRRTPVCAVCSEVPWSFPQAPNSDPTESDLVVPLAAEVFATTLDVHLVNGDIPESPGETDTADGRPATRQHALNRLAHMVCCDLSEVSEVQLCEMSRYIADSQAATILRAVRCRLDYLREISGDPEHRPEVLISGSGAWLAASLLQELGPSQFSAVSNLSEMYFRNVSNCAPAFAAARLAAERCTDDLLPLSAWT